MSYYKINDCRATAIANCVRKVLTDMRCSYSILLGCLVMPYTNDNIVSNTGEGSRQRDHLLVVHYKDTNYPEKTTYNPGKIGRLLTSFRRSSKRFLLMLSGNINDHLVIIL